MSNDAQPSLFDDPEPDYTDTSTWIRVDRPAIRKLIEPNGDGEPIIRYIITGNIESTYRLRTEADGDAASITLPPDIPQPRPEEKITWPDWGEGERNRVDPRVLSKHQKDAPAYHPATALGFGALSWQSRNNRNLEK